MFVAIEFPVSRRRSEQTLQHFIEGKSSNEKTITNNIMIFQLVGLLLLLGVVHGFRYAQPYVVRSRLDMYIGANTIGKAISFAVIGAGLTGPILRPLVANADGAVSASTVFRARNFYGNKIKDLSDDASKGNFAAFENKKTLNAFDLFISESNAQRSAIAKERKKAELALQAKIYDAVKNKDRAQLAANYNQFIKVADLTSEFKLTDAGQTDSSGYSPTYGTPRQQLYVR